MVVFISPGFSLTSEYPSMSLTGTHNNWTPGAMPMTLIADYSWRVAAEFAEGGEFKFTPFDNWSVSFGIGGGPGNIPITEGAGKYRITFNDKDKTYAIVKISGDFNEIPIANAGSDITVSVGDDVRFDGSGSKDIDGTIESYSWSNGLKGAAPTMAYNTPGTYSVMLAVTDNKGAMAVDTLIVTVKDPNAFNSEYETMFLAGTNNGWTPGATPMTLAADNRWRVTAEFADGGQFKFTPFDNWSVSFGTNGGPANIHITEGAGQYTIEFDDKTKNYTITKNKVNKIPIADAGKDIVTNVGSTVTFDASASNDPDGTIVSYDWDNGLRGVKPTKLYDKLGNYTVALTVTDNEGATATDTVQVTITEHVQFKSQYETMSLTGSHNNWVPGAMPMTLTADYTWSATSDFGDNGEFKFTPFDNWSVSFGRDGGAANIPVPNGAGTYDITFNDKLKTYTVKKKTGPKPPVANAGNDITVGVGSTVTFDASDSKDFDGTIVSYKWKGDIGVLTGVNPTSQPFNSFGKYPITLTVTDNDGLQDTDTVVVTVDAPVGLSQRFIIDPPLAFPLTGTVGGGDYSFKEPFPNLANEFKELVYVGHDGVTDRIFVVEKQGIIKVFDNKPDIRPEEVKTFLDIRDVVHNEHERGLLGLAFDPDYETNGYFYIFYSSKIKSPGFDNGDSKVERWKVNPNDPYKALDGSRVELLSEPQQGPDHKGGMMAFSPIDGYLYISFGDGQYSDEPERSGEGHWQRGNKNGQDLTTRRGSIIRIDPIDTPAGGYTVPADNPFSGTFDPEGKTLYDNKCASCHGPQGEGGFAPNLKTTRFNTFETLNTKIVSTMPPADPAQCGGNCSSKVSGYILNAFMGIGLPSQGNEITREIWAYGLRNPWRFDFDNDGTLWVGDTGQHVWEEVDIILKGKNYGWPACDGNDTRNLSNYMLNVDCDNSTNSGDFIPPITAYNHNGNAASIIGGIVYRGTSLPELNGKFIYGDYDTSRIWAIDKNAPTEQITIPGFGKNGNISSFGIDLNGSVYITSFRHGGDNERPRSKIWQIVDESSSAATVPELLSQTNLFSDTANLVPAKGVIEYALNAPSWTDGSIKTYYIALPGTEKIVFDAIDTWKLPVGTALVKHAEMPINAGGKTRRLDTAVMFRQIDGWAYFNYRWNETQSDAELLKEAVTISLNAFFNGELQRQVRTLNGPENCTICHIGDPVVGLNARQLNSDFQYESTTDNQLRSWNNIELFTENIGEHNNYEAFINPSNTSFPLEKRAKVYLHTNCAHCHSDPKNIDTRYDTPLKDMSLLNSPTTIGEFKIKPFDPENSGVYLRQSSDSGRMPRGSRYSNPMALDLVYKWIKGEGAVLESISVEADAATLDINASTTLKVNGFYSNNFVAPLTQKVSWKSSSPRVINVEGKDSPSITVAASEGGTTILTASVSGVEPAQIALRVLDTSRVDSIAITPKTIELIEQQQLIAVAAHADGSESNITNLVEWEVISGADAVMVSESGLLTSIQRGEAVIEASYNGKTAKAAITSLGPGFYVYFDNTGNWDQVFVHLWTGQDNVVTRWPGLKLPKITKNLYGTYISEDMSLSGSINLVFNNGQGTQTNDLTRDKAGTYNFGEGKWKEEGDLVAGITHNLILIDAAPVGSYREGALVSVQATPGPSKTFRRWEGSGIPYILGNNDVANIQIVMPDKDIALTAISTGFDPEGKSLYDNRCAECHGVQGEGGVGTNLQKSRFNTLEMLTAKINSTMPPQPLYNPDDCIADCADKVAGYIFSEFQGRSISCKTDADLKPAPRQLRLLTRQEYNNTVIDLLGLSGDITIADNFPPETSVMYFDNNAENALVSEPHVEAYLNASEELASTVDIIKTTNDIRTFGKRAFRRPLTSDEFDRYVALLNKHGASAVVQAMLSSPHFLYRSELGEIQEDGIYRLNDYEIATVLSYMFWETMPDQTLFDAADRGQLNTLEQIKSQAERMLLDPRARRTIEHFAIQWLGVDHVNGISRNDPSFTPEIASAMREETGSFVANVIFNSTKKYDELFTADYTIASPLLASYYGLEPGGTDNKVMYTNNQRSGILGHGSILATYSTSEEPHPIKRGVFVRQRILCQKLPVPPADVMAVFPEVDHNLTTKERFEKHKEVGTSCYACHKYIDGIGFGFEHFNAVGKWRTTQGPLKLPIDARGDLNYLEGLSGSETHATYDTIPELGAIIADSQSGKSCFVRNYYRYVKGYVETEADNCSLEVLSRKLINGDVNLQEFMVELTQAPNFVLRK